MDEFHQADFGDPVQRGLIGLPQVDRQLRVSTVLSGILDRGDQRIGILVWSSASFVDPDQVRHYGIRRLSNIALVIEFLPEFFPRAAWIISNFQRQKCRTWI